MRWKGKCCFCFWNRAAQEWWGIPTGAVRIVTNVVQGVDLHRELVSVEELMLALWAQMLRSCICGGGAPIIRALSTKRHFGYAKPFVQHKWKCSKQEQLGDVSKNAFLTTGIAALTFTRERPRPLPACTSLPLVFLYPVIIITVTLKDRHLQNIPSFMFPFFGATRLLLASSFQPLRPHLSWDIRVCISTAPTQVAAILEKSREDISPCAECLLEACGWVTAITRVSEVKGVMSNWGLTLQGCQILAPCAPYGEKQSVQALSKEFTILKTKWFFLTSGPHSTEQEPSETWENQILAAYLASVPSAHPYQLVHHILGRRTIDAW